MSLRGLLMLKDSSLSNTKDITKCHNIFKLVCQLTHGSITIGVKTYNYGGKSVVGYVRRLRPLVLLLLNCLRDFLFRAFFWGGVCDFDVG